MDKKFFLAFSISLLLLLVYPYYLKKITPPAPATDEVAVTISKPVQEKIESPEIILKKQQALNKVSAKTYKIENEKLFLQLTDLGGRVETISLKGIKDKKTGEEVALLLPSENNAGMDILLHRDVDTKDQLFHVITENSGAVTFQSRIGDYEITKTFSLREEGYLFDFTVILKNLNPAAEISGQYEFLASADVAVDTSYDEHFRKMSVLLGESVKVSDFAKIQKRGAIVEGASRWTALLKKYFGIFIVPQFETAHVRGRVDGKTELTAILKTTDRKIAPGQSQEDHYIVFSGPLAYDLLKSEGMHFEKIMTGGFWGAFRLLLLSLLGYFYKIFSNYGLAIIALTITIKILFIPLTQKSFNSMRKMQELQPKLKALQDQYQKDPQKLNKEVMELYKKHRVNPAGGCFPILLQMPIFIALYQTLSESVELRGAPFAGWIRDLSEPDRLVSFPFTIPLVNIDALNILPLLMTISMVVQQKMTPAAGQTKEQQNMMLFMSVIFGFIFYNLPSGLVLYWFLNNVISIIHQIISHRKPTTEASA